jgi:hypothetical protein
MQKFDRNCELSVEGKMNRDAFPKKENIFICAPAR